MMEKKTQKNSENNSGNEIVKSFFANLANPTKQRKLKESGEKKLNKSIQRESKNVPLKNDEYVEDEKKPIKRKKLILGQYMILPLDEVLDIAVVRRVSRFLFEDEAKEHRSLFCKHLSKCVENIEKGGWRGYFSCIECPQFSNPKAEDHGWREACYLKSFHQ